MITAIELGARYNVFRETFPSDKEFLLRLAHKFEGREHLVHEMTFVICLLQDFI